MPPFFIRWIPTRERILSLRMLAPFARQLGDDSLWSTNRHSVAKAVSIGLFFGVMIPVAQFLFAVVTALFLRAHVAISAACTLVSNPFTFPPIYWAAYELGSLVLSRRVSQAEASHVEETVGVIGDPTTGWFDGFWIWLASAGLPLVTGLFIMACTAAAIGYVAVHLLWRERRG